MASASISVTFEIHASGKVQEMEASMTDIAMTSQSNADLASRDLSKIMTKDDMKLIDIMARTEAGRARIMSLGKQKQNGDRLRKAGTMLLGAAAVTAGAAAAGAFTLTTGIGLETIGSYFGIASPEAFASSGLPGMGSVLKNNAMQETQKAVFMGSVAAMGAGTAFAAAGKKLTDKANFRFGYKDLKEKLKQSGRGLLKSLDQTLDRADAGVKGIQGLGVIGLAKEMGKKTELYEQQRARNRGAAPLQA